MRTTCSTTSLLAAAVLIPFAVQAASTVTFDNKSGKTALVKLVGPTASSVSVENSKKELVSVGPGHYFIKVRYGTPGAYSYSKGDEFDVTETASTASAITITLHKVVSGNYGSKPISESEFGADDGKEKPAERRSWQTDPALFVKEVQQLIDDASLTPEQAIKRLLAGQPADIEWRGKLFSIMPATPFTTFPVVEIQMDGLALRHQKTNDYRISRIGLLPASDEWKKWGELYEKTKSLPGTELLKRQVVFRTSLQPQPLAYKCKGNLFLGLVTDHGKLAALSSLTVCLPENSPPHYHVGLTVKGGELVSEAAPDAQGQHNDSGLEATRR